MLVRLERGLGCPLDHLGLALDGLARRRERIVRYPAHRPTRKRHDPRAKRRNHRRTGLFGRICPVFMLTFLLLKAGAVLMQPQVERVVVVMVAVARFVRIMPRIMVVCLVLVL